MLLAIDIGNTSIHFGAFEGNRLRGEWRTTTAPHKTSDEYGVAIKEFLQISGLGSRAIGGVALCSVVPILTPVFSEASVKYFRSKPLVVTAESRLGLKVLYDPPREVGPDRIVNAVAAFHRYRDSVIIVDFGTATTIDIVSKKKEYIGGVIAPGVMISAEALFSRAAKLSAVELIRPKKVIGRDTVSSVQSGIVNGYAAMVDGLVERIQHELGEKGHVVATGGQAGLITPQCKTVEETRPYLTLEGLRLIFTNGKKI
jgi:type III pantothenate kinase